MALQQDQPDSLVRQGDAPKGEEQHERHPDLNQQIVYRELAQSDSSHILLS
jgi:hypothetical protein